MISRTTERFWKAYRLLPESVRDQARNAYKLFLQDPFTSGLRFKHVHPNQPIYSVRINSDYRAVGIRDNEEIVWFWIGPHAEYDHLISQF